MTDYSGMDQGPSWDNVFRRYVADGMDKGIAKVALASCIDWENRPYTELVAHAQHAERTLQQQKEKKASNLQCAQMAYYQGNPLKRGRGGRGRGSRGRSYAALAASSSASTDAPSPGCRPAAPDLAKELAALKTEIIQAVSSEVTRALTAEFHAISKEYHSRIQVELQEMRSELLQDNASLKTEIGSIKGTVSEVETSLSGLSDEVVDLRAKVVSLTRDLAKIDARCEDLEARSRRQNIRLIGIPENDSRFILSNSSVSELLKEAFSLEKSPLVDPVQDPANPLAQ
ncbi:hypothetical protein NFI96_004814 [Prochilodus magdalenae]|nr:hypothetical protein NFI96_004814 [Prochilodus magdalenae]